MRSACFDIKKIPFCPHKCICMFRVILKINTISAHIINRVVFVMVTQCVYCGEGTEILYITRIHSILESLIIVDVPLDGRQSGGSKYMITPFFALE
jgi:hypothetical protein